MRKSKTSSKWRVTASDYKKINETAIASAPVFLKRLFPTRRGNKLILSKEFKKKNRSFSKLEINGYNCKWHDGATGEKGDTPISLLPMQLVSTKTKPLALLPE